jgi:Flp pilus assembly protein TadD
VELAPIAQPEPIVATRPPDTDTIFIDAAIAGWRASAGAGAGAGGAEAARDAEPSAGAEEELPTTRVVPPVLVAGADEEPPTTRVLSPVVAAEALEQPATRVGFRGASRTAQGDTALESGESSQPGEEPAADMASVPVPALQSAGEPTHGFTDKPHAFVRPYVAVPLVLTVLAAMLWAVLALDSATARSSASLRAHDARTAARSVAGSLDATRAAPTQSPAVSGPAANTPRALPVTASAQPAVARTTLQTAPALRSPASTKQNGLGVVARASSERELANALRAMARTHFRRAEFELAAQTYRLAIKASPGYAGSYAGLGASQLALGDALGAISSYKQAIRRSPGSSGFHAALGRAYVMTRNRDRALAEYRMAVALDPANEVAVRALARLTS